MNITHILILAGGVVVGILISLPDILKVLRIRRTTTVWMNSLPNSGQVEVIGKVDCSPIQSPIKKESCVFWELQVQEQKKNKNRMSWSTVLSRRSEEPFVLNDGTGKVTVIPAGGELVLENASCDALEDLPTDARDYLVHSGISLKSFLGFDKHFRIIEKTICPDQEIYVLGQADERGGQAVITTNGGGIISDSSEQSVSANYLTRIAGKVITAVVVSAAIDIYLIFMK